MSLLNFPDEVTLQFLQKLNLYERINVCMTHPKLFPLCFDRSLDRNSTKTILLYELRKLYQQSRTEKEKDQCFNPQILDRLRTKSFNEVVHLNMDPENNNFFANHKILHSFKGQIVLESENKQFSDNFYQHFLSLIDKIEGNLLLVFVDFFKQYENNYAERCAQILSRKLERGEKVFCIDFHLQQWHNTHGFDIQKHMNEGFTVYYGSCPGYKNRVHCLRILKINSVENTETLIGMIDEDRFIEAKQHLGRVLPLVKAAELPGGGGDIRCRNCFAHQSPVGNEICCIWMLEPKWSNCAGCRFER